MPSIFLCHSSKDKPFVRKLAEGLREYGIKVWLDEAEIKVGDSLTEKIGIAIDKTDFFGVVLSKNSINSEWVKRELEIAIQKQLTKKSVVVLPLLLEKVKIPPFLRDKKYADFSESKNFDSEFLNLLKALGVQRAKTQEFVESSMSTGVQEAAGSYRPTQFEDIRIIGLDDKKTFKPDLKGGLQDIYVELSIEPPEDWKRIFEYERQMPRHTMWRKAWIQGKYIVVRCVLEEMEKYHAEDLKVNVVNTNAKYREYLSIIEKENAERLKQQELELKKLEEMKQKLKFD